MTDSEARCALHPERPAVGTCKRCGSFACGPCAVDRDGGAVCRACARRERPDRLKLWQAVLALVFGGIAAQMAGFVPVIVAVAFVMAQGVPLEELQGALEAVIPTFWVLGPAILLTGGTMALVAMLTPMLARVPAKQALALRGAPWPAFVVAPIGILSLGPTSDGLRRVMEAYLPDLTFGTLEGLDAVARSAPLWLIVPAMAFIPGIAEELLFRGMFQSAIRRVWLGVVVSGLLFAAYHVDPHHVVPIIPLGLYLAWLRARTRSTFVPITAHIANNATAVVAAVTMGADMAAEELDWWWIPIGWVVCALTIGITWWVTRERPAPVAVHEPAI